MAIISRAVFLVCLSSKSILPSTWQNVHSTPSEAEINVIAGTNWSAGVPLSWIIFLNVCSAVLGSAVWAFNRPAAKIVVKSSWARCINPPGVFLNCTRIGVGRRKRLPHDALEPGDFREMKTAHLHGRDHHVERLFSRCAHGRRERFHVVEQFDKSLVEAEIPQPASQAAVFNQEGAVASHPGHDFREWIYFADVPEPRDQDPSCSGSNHLVDRTGASSDHNVHGRFANLVWHGETMASGLDPRPAGARTRVSQLARNSGIHQREVSALDAPTIQGNSGL